MCSNLRLEDIQEQGVQNNTSETIWKETPKKRTHEVKLTKNNELTFK